MRRPLRKGAPVRRTTGRADPATLGQPALGAIRPDRRHCPDRGAHAGPTWSATEQLVDEMRGIAAGAEVPFETVLDINTASSVHYIQDFRADGLAGAVIRGARITPRKQTWWPGSLMAVPTLLSPQHRTGHSWAEQTMVTRPFRPSASLQPGCCSTPGQKVVPSTSQLSTVGLLSGVAVMNAHGFAVGQSAAQVVPGQDGYGVPTTLILRPLVERCASVDEALALLAERDLAGKGLNMLLMDDAGTVRAAEKSGNRLGVREPDENGVLYFSNHCHTPGLKELPPRHDRDNSHRRWAHLQDRFGHASTDHSVNGKTNVASKSGSLNGATGDSGMAHSSGQAGESDWERMRRVITSHGSQPGPGGAGEICQHGPQMFTSLGMLISPRQRTLWTADGAPCSTHFVEHRLSSTAG